MHVCQSLDVSRDSMIIHYLGDMATCLDLYASILNSGDQSGIHSEKEWHRHILEGQKSLIARRMAGRVIWSDSNTILRQIKSVTMPAGIVSYPDPRLRKHYRLLNLR